jgi:hypothetical protein
MANNSNKYKKLIIIGSIMLLILLGVGYNQTMHVDASVRPSASEIPDGTLIIGTHLIALEALQQENLDIALRSVDDMRTREDGIVQDQVYYKSDLNQGIWYDITNAERINDISLSTNYAVSNEVIDKLILTHWTKSDGITIELATGKQLSLQEIYDMTETSNMPEVALLAIEKDVQEGKLKALQAEAKDMDEEDEGYEELKDQIEQTKEKIDSIERIMAPLLDQEIVKAEQLLDKYDNFIQNLRNDKKAPDSLINLATEEKALVKAGRDAITYEMMIERVNDETIVASMLEDGDLLNKYGSAVNELQQSLTDASLAADVGESEKTLDIMNQDFAKQMLEQINGNNNQAAYNNLIKMQAIKSIYDNRILDRPLEIEILEQSMDMLTGEIEKAAKNTDIEESENTSTLQDRLKEMEELLDYYIFRIDSGFHEQAVQACLEQVRELEDDVNFDEGIDEKLKKQLLDVIQDSEAALSKGLAEIKAKQSPIMSNQLNEQNRLQKLEDELQEQYFAAAEQGDLAAMERVKEQLDAANALLQSEQDKAAEQYKDLLDEMRNLEDKLVKATSDRDKKQLRAEADQILMQMAGLEGLLDGKSLNGLEQLAELQAEIKDGINNNELSNASQLTGELIDLLALLPDNLMGAEQKHQELQNVLNQMQDKTEQYDSQGNNGAANNLLTIADQLTDLALDKGIGGTKPVITLPTISPYSIIFVDRGVNVREPVTYKNDTAYVVGRRIFEALGANVQWQPDRQHIVAQDPKYAMLVEYTAYKDVVYVNNRRVRLQHPVEIIDGHTYIPLQIILDAYRMDSELRDGVIYAHTRQ